MKSKITEVKNSLNTSTNQDGVTETGLLSWQKHHKKGTMYEMPVLWLALDIGQWRAATPERQETNEVSPTTAPACCLQGGPSCGAGKGDRVEPSGLSDLKRHSRESRKTTKKAKIRWTEYWTGDGYKERGLELQRVPLKDSPESGQHRHVRKPPDTARRTIQGNRRGQCSHNWKPRCACGNQQRRQRVLPPQ